MQVLRNKIWVSCVLLLVLHQVAQKILYWDIVFIDSYLDPFLSIPILLGLILQERQFLITKYFSPNKEEGDYSFSILETTIATVFFAIVFEEKFPKWSASFTKDYWDYLAYFSGALMFYLFINKAP